jgi:membrane protease YdiL (CAAX protease family)
MSARPEPGSTRDLLELIFGYGLILFVLWMPEFPQRILSPVALVVTLAMVLARRPGPEGRLNDLGIGRRGLARSFWILPAAIVLSTVSVLTARQIGTLHSLYKGDFKHIAGYIAWTLYQQFLMNDLFMPRLTRLLGSESAALGVAAVLFAAAHLPNLPLTAVTLIWGAISCALFLRYRNIYALGLAQGLLGLCFAVCVPDALHTICEWVWDICAIRRRGLVRTTTTRASPRRCE